MKKKKKRVLTEEEKRERKQANKYKIFYNKVLAIIASVIFILSAIGATIIEVSSARLESASELMVVLGMVTTIGTIVMPFLIFRKITLAVLAIGSVWLDMGIISNGKEALGLGILAIGVALILMIIVMKVHNKKFKNCNIKLDINLLAVLVEDCESGNIEKTLDAGCYIETLYKAKYYLTASVIAVLGCGIGLFLPFGAWAGNYFKGLGILFGDIKEKSDSAKYDENKPFKNLLQKNEFYFYGKTFTSESLFYKYANAGMISSFCYILLTSLRVFIKKPTYMDEDNIYAGTVAFSTNGVFDVAPEIARAFIVYSKKQSEENRQYFIDALQDLSDSYNEWSEREGKRLNAYEKEKWRYARKYAQGTTVTTDGKDFYVEGSYGGVSGSKKLEAFDKTTGVGYYTDENGQKVEIKNINVKNK